MNFRQFDATTPKLLTISMFGFPLPDVAKFSCSWFNVTSACCVHNSLLKSCTFGFSKAHANGGSLWALDGCQSCRDSCVAGTVVSKDAENHYESTLHVKEEVRTAQRTQRALIRQTNRWMLVREIDTGVVRIGRTREHITWNKCWF
jgi:hypothetical protein